jgi:hypothetical protein
MRVRSACPWRHQFPESVEVLPRRLDWVLLFPRGVDRMLPEFKIWDVAGTIRENVSGRNSDKNLSAGKFLKHRIIELHLRPTIDSQAARLLANAQEQQPHIRIDL